jgi:hypothetical protein
MLSAQAEENTIPFIVDVTKSKEGEEVVWSNTYFAPANPITRKKVDISKSVLETAVNKMKESGCEVLDNGSITVSLDVTLEAGIWVVGVGTTSGIAMTFECKGGHAI